MRIWKGCIAGVAGGLLGAFAMSKVHAALQQLASAPPQKGEDSTEKAAAELSRLVLHRELVGGKKKAAGPIVHYTFGAATGGLYGIAAEINPLVRSGGGALFGIAVWLGAHVIAVPAFGLAEPITRSSAGQETAEFGAHLAYGTVVELVRVSLQRAFNARCA